MSKQRRIIEQLRNNAVALISLVVAVTSLSYNTWRNEKSEYNRNQREAAFQVLLALGELQQVAWLNHYDQDVTGAGNPRAGWALVLTIEDLCELLAEPVPMNASALTAAWEDNWASLGKRDASGQLINTGNDRIRAEILKLRADTRSLLAALD